MKKIIFLLLIVASSVFGGTCYNSSKDKLTLSNTATSQCKLSSRPVNVIVHDNCDVNYAYMYSSPLYSNYCTDSIYTQNTKYTHQVFLVDRNYQCPAGQEVINGACAVPPTCTAPKVWNSDTDTCVCPPRPVGYNFDAPASNASECTMSSPMLAAIPDGQTAYVVDVIWSDCSSTCYAKVASCPTGQAIKNNTCATVVPDSNPCTSTFTCSIMNLGLNGASSCNLGCYCDGTTDPAFFTQDVSCGDYPNDYNLTGGTSSPDTNTTNPDTNPDSNSTNPGDSGEDGQTEDGEDGSTTPGDSNTTTPDNGWESNTTTSGDSNSSAPGEYEDSDADKEGKGKIANALDDAYSTLDKIKSDYERIMNALENGVTPISITSGQAPQFCATVFGKQICINLCDSFGYFYSIFYYIFLILFTVMALRIYYTAFKMR